MELRETKFQIGCLGDHLFTGNTAGENLTSPLRSGPDIFPAVHVTDRKLYPI